MRRVWRLTGFVVVCLAFLALAVAGIGITGLLGENRRRAFIKWGTRAWARSLLGVMNIRVTAEGLKPDYFERSRLLVSNHLSYIDIIIIDAVFPASFIAKTEVGDWPLLGPLAGLGKSVFIVREDARSNVRGFYEACGRFRDGYSVAVFPEGTTGDGEGLLPFKPLFIGLAKRARVDILPVTINFRSVNGEIFDRRNRDLICWYSDIEFGPHFWQFLTVDHLDVSVIFHEPIRAPRGIRTRELAETVRSVIGDGYTGFSEKFEIPGETIATSEETVKLQ